MCDFIFPILSFLTETLIYVGQLKMIKINVYCTENLSRKVINSTDTKTLHLM